MGFFTKIKGVLIPAREEITDPVFGVLQRKGKGLWMGEVRFEHGPTRLKKIGMLIDGSGGHPADLQRALFVEIAGRYGRLWPQIAAALAASHPSLKTIECIERHLGEPCMMLEPLQEGQPREWSIDYTFELETEGDMGYTVQFREWELLEIEMGD